jgi:glycosyltransferase involved in cell wall biosynthesis
MTSALKVLHVYSGNLYGGIETFLATVARHAHLAPEMTSEFALCFAGRLAAELAEAGAFVHDLGVVRTRAPWSVLRARSRLARLARDRSYDAIVCHSPWAQAVFGQVPAGSGVPGVFWLHEAVQGRHWLERWARRTHPTFCVANSHYSKSTLSLIFRDTPARVIYCPVAFRADPLSVPERASLRREFGADDATVIIVQTSRMQPLKGQKRLLRALARLRSDNPWLCLQVGGPQRPEERAYFEDLRVEARELGIAERVHFLGERTDVPRLFAASDVYCQPNNRPDSFGIALIEALAAGLPVVTADIGGPREIVSPDVGFLVGEDRALADTLERLIGDADLRRSLGARGPLRAKELCDPALRLPEIARVLEEAIGRAPTPNVAA